MTGMKQLSETLAGMGTEGSDIRVGLDVGDTCSRWSAIDLLTGEVRDGRMTTSREGVAACFGAARHCTVAFEAGTHSSWLYWSLRELRHRAAVLPSDVLRQGSGKKRRRNDAKDAEALRELAVDVDRARVKQLWQRTPGQQRELALLRARDAAVRARALLANAVRGLVKPSGERLGRHSVESLPNFARQELSAEALALVGPLLPQIESLTEAVDNYDREVEAYLESRPDAARLLQVHGVGPITVAAIMAVVADPQRIKHSRDLGAYLGLVPGEDQSGGHDPQLHITKTGNALARRTLVQAAHFMMSARGKDCALRRWALARIGDGKNKILKKRIAIALARKLAVLLHRLWVSGEDYQPLRGLALEQEGVAA
jgi:transposase